MGEPYLKAYYFSLLCARSTDSGTEEKKYKLKISFFIFKKYLLLPEPGWPHGGGGGAGVTAP